MSSPSSHRKLLLPSIALLTSGAIFVTAGGAAQAVEAQTPTTAVTEQAVPPLTAEQRQYIEQTMGPALVEIQKAQAQQAPEGPQAQAFPIAAAAIAAAAWCAKGALGSVATSVISDVANGGNAGGDYVRNAIIGCLGGEIGGVVWKFLPGWVKQKAIEMVAAFIIKYIR